MSRIVIVMFMIEDRGNIEMAVNFFISLLGNGCNCFGVMSCLCHGKV
jgi:hypothetical protein